MKYLVSLFALLLLGTTPLHAQGVDLGFAGYGGYNTTYDGGLVGVGLDIDGLGQVGPITGGAWVDIETHFPEGESVIQVNANLTPKYDIGDFELTAGVGIGYVRFSPDNSDSFSETGLNVLGGVEWDRGGLNPFVRYRCTRLDGQSSRAFLFGLIIGM